MNGNNEIKTVKTEDIDDILKTSNEVYTNEVVEAPDYSYGADQMPLNGKYQVRNIDTGGGKYYGNIIVDNSTNGNITITGVGFTPKLIKLTATYSDGASSAFSVGHYVNGRNNSVTSYENATDYSDNSRCFRLGGTNGLGRVTSVNSDGFILNVHNPGGITYTVIYECFG